MSMITVCILTKNAEKTLQATLESVRFFSEVIVLDSGSSDHTLELARKFSNVTVYETQFCGFGKLRNKIAELATNDWIFAIDSDEVLSTPQEIFTIPLDPQFAYTFPRHNFYRGKRIRGCGWSPDRVARLYHRKTTRFSSAEVHESLETKKLIFLQTPLLHTPYRSTEDFLAKMQHYTTLFAKQNQGKKKSSFSQALAHGIFTFFKSYIIKMGFLDGSEGFIISQYNSHTAFYKYLKLRDLAAPSPQSPHLEQSQSLPPLHSK